jgi:hypothetical protein
MRRKALAKANSSLLHHTQPHTQQRTICKRYMGCARNSKHTLTHTTHSMSTSLWLGKLVLVLVRGPREEVGWFFTPRCPRWTGRHINNCFKLWMQCHLHPRSMSPRVIKKGRRRLWRRPTRKTHHPKTGRAPSRGAANQIELPKLELPRTWQCRDS